MPPCCLVLSCGGACTTELSITPLHPFLPQRTWDIWSFAISFAVRLWWSGKKLAYRRTGMTPEAVSAKKTELVRTWGRRLSLDAVLRPGMVCSMHGLEDPVSKTAPKI